MKSTLRLLAALLCLSAAARLPAQLVPPKLAVPYGHNDAAGAFAEVNGIKLYYETYGQGAPLLMIHGNGGDISHMGYQTAHFSKQYRVIVTDSRSHGRSGAGTGRLTYEQMAEDLNALLDHLKLKSVYVLGWSDGGILSLLLAIHHPDKVAKMAIMGANLFPEGAYPWALAAVAADVKRTQAMIAKGDKTQPWAHNLELLDLLGQQPHISTAEVETIAAPTLVMAGDKDVITLEHTTLIFEHLKQAHLAIFPGSTHMVAWDDPELLNRTVEKFFATPFTRPETRAQFGM